MPRQVANRSLASGPRPEPTALLPWRSARSSCLLSRVPAPRQVSVSRNRPSATSPCQTQVLLPLVRAGLPQGAKMCVRTSGHERRWRGKSLSLSPQVTARFPGGRNWGSMRATAGTEFHLSRYSAGWMHCLEEAVLCQPVEARSAWSEGDLGLSGADLSPKALSDPSLH